MAISNNKISRQTYTAIETSSYLITIPLIVYLNQLTSVFVETLCMYSECKSARFLYKRYQIMRLVIKQKLSADGDFNVTMHLAMRIIHLVTVFSVILAKMSYFVNGK